MASRPSVIITAAAGLTGTMIIRDMLKGSRAQHFKSVAGLTHPGSHPSDLIEMGASIHGVDAENFQSLVEIFTSKDVLVIIPTEDVFGIRVRHGINYLRAAREGRVKHVILYSSVGCENPEAPHLHQFYNVEQYLQYETDIPNWTIVRCNFYMQNLLLFAQQFKNEGCMRLPIGDDPFHSKCAFIDVRDVAHAFSALASHPRDLQTRHNHQIYTLTSESPLTASNISSIFSVTYQSTIPILTNVSLKDTFSYLHRVADDKQFIQQLSSLNQISPNLMFPFRKLTENEIERILEFFTLWSNGRLNFLTLDIYHLTGRSAHTLGQFLKDYSIVFRGR